VRLGPSVGGKRVIRSGLDAGERVVVAGLQRVRPGMPVTPQEQLARSDKPIQTAQRSTLASASSGAN
jgi:membrane fusion protein, multidrug efflux system